MAEFNAIDLIYTLNNGDQLRTKDGVEFQLRYLITPNEFGPWHNIYYKDASRLLSEERHG